MEYKSRKILSKVLFAAAVAELAVSAVGFYVFPAPEHEGVNELAAHMIQHCDNETNFGGKITDEDSCIDALATALVDSGSVQLGEVPISKDQVLGAIESYKSQKHKSNLPFVGLGIGLSLGIAGFVAYPKRKEDSEYNL
ncbi:hypothetical protein HOK51_02190 [Candidatus Woesearchaeota archaeon]|jgi:hypothetical protein|nr:hypothetical protein [Candidatus Woesearchaeota archaeon]MBT6518626.1 hypothetical protein [Candidatus Woesearchaeota archaeon]MBT7368049.1 hypothetical protein [Candidatus Woesearchaeota archaeon]